MIRPLRWFLGPSNDMKIAETKGYIQGLRDAARIVDERKSWTYSSGRLKTLINQNVRLLEELKKRGRHKHEWYRVGYGGAGWHAYQCVGCPKEEIR